MTSNDVELAPGTLLVAAPMMQDPNFRRAVILLCEHKVNEGSFGLVLNRPLDVKLGDVMEEFFAYDPQLRLGGPVQRDTLHFLHRHPDAVDGGMALSDGVQWGGDFEAVKALLQGGDVSEGDLRFFLGYAGWSPDQLADEVEEDAWILAPSAADLVFADVPDQQLWRAVLRRMGGEYAILANFPDDPRMN